MNEIETLLFYMADGDLTKKELLKETDLFDLYNWFYLRKVKELNELLLLKQTLKNSNA